MPFRTKLQIALTLLATVGVTVVASHAATGAWAQFWLLLVVILASSGLKVVLPRGDGSMSLNFPFILLGIIQLSPLQAMLLAAISVAAQCRIRVEKLFTAVQTVFNVANAMLATACACFTFATLHKVGVATAPSLAGASLAYFVWSTFSVAMVIAPSNGRNVFQLWASAYPWYLPFYLVGAALASTVQWMSLRFGWATALLLVPVVYTLYRSYMSQMTRLRERQQHLEETEALHLRTIEGLAMAIEAKDQNTHDHLFRVRHYVKAVGQQLRLSPLEMQALETAAFLHDIGKLAVPEHIINKPGKLTPEEFEKMKIHPVVGADLLERVRFPYPVVPIVRSHHEWWDGTGYPDGLSGESIPIGARILTVVDCFDALVSDRPYRKGMTSAQALELISKLQGRQFDPKVVEVFQHCYADAESRMEHFVPPGFTPLNTEVEVSRGLAPGAGFQADAGNVPSINASSDPVVADFEVHQSTLRTVATATQEVQEIFEISQNHTFALRPDELFSLLAGRLRRLVAFQLCVLHVKHGDQLEPRFLHGAHAEDFKPDPIPAGEGLSGWVAQSGKSLLNGNASVEPNCPSLGNGTAIFKSALAVPLLDFGSSVTAVLTLYSRAEDAFSRSDLRVVSTMASKLSLLLEDLLAPQPPAAETEMDSTTGLATASGFFLKVGETLAAFAGDPSAVVIVCDLNGFSALNDRRGRSAGDRVLRLFADGLQQMCLGQQATAARLGGDEFALLLAHADESTGMERLQAIRHLAKVLSKRLGNGQEITVSAGAAYAPADGTIAEDLLSVAHRRMALEKRNFHRESAACVPSQRLSLQTAALNA